MMGRLLVFFCLGLPLYALQAPVRTETLDNDAIVTMVRAGLSEEIVLAKIQSTANNFDVSAQALADLKKNGVSERVIMAMLETAKPQRQVQPGQPRAPQTGTTPVPRTLPGPQPRPTPPRDVAGSTSYDEEGIETGIIFGGIAYSRGDLHENFFGWGASLTTALTDHLGLKSDFSGVYTSVQDTTLDWSLYSFLVGPEFRGRMETTHVFAHALVGLSRTGGALTFRNAGDNNVQFVFGGGLDFWLSESFGVRPIQGDYQLIRAGGESVHMARLSAGAVFRF